MMIDDDTLKQLLADQRTVAAMQVSERQARHRNFISSDTPGGRPDAYSDRSWQEQIAVMHPMAAA
jgi:hypothetical protein